MIQLNLKSQNYTFFVYSFTFYIFCFLCPLWLYIFYLCYFCILNILLRTVERIVNVKLYMLYVSCLNTFAAMCGPRRDLRWVALVECISKSRLRGVSFLTHMSTPMLEPNLLLLLRLCTLTVQYTLMIWFLSKCTDSFTYL